jgi:hypothetical protein
MEQNSVPETYTWDCKNTKKESGQKGMEGTEFQEFPGMGGPELMEPKKGMHILACIGTCTTIPADVTIINS